MNAWLSWRPNERLAQVMRGALRQGTRLSHHLFSVVGGFAVLFALSLWLLPNWRLMLATRLMPFISSAVQAGPARLLQGNPLPSFAPHQRGNAAPQDDTLSTSSNTGDNANNGPATAADASVNVASDNSSSFSLPASTGLSAAALNGLDPRTLPSVSTIAAMIPSQHVSADARDDRVLVSTREQDLVASFLSRRYRVAQEPVSELVKAAFDTGREVGLDPLLLLAVMAIESGFNPYAESGVGAKGLMQVMSTVHSDKFRYFGGQGAALEPLANIKVGAIVLKDCIARGGSLPGGLRLYVGSTSPDDGGYGAKVMAERGRLRDVAHGRKVPINAPQSPVTVQASTSSTPAATSNASNKRVQMTLDAHPIAAAAAKSTQQQSDKDSEQDDASSGAKHAAQQPELGA